MAPRKFRFFFHHTCSHMLATGLNTPPTNALETSKAFALSVFIHFCIWGCMTASWASADCWSIVKKLKHIRRDFAQSIKISSFFITGLLIDSNTVCEAYLLRTADWISCCLGVSADMLLNLFSKQTLAADLDRLCEDVLLLPRGSVGLSSPLNLASTKPGTSP